MVLDTLYTLNELQKIAPKDSVLDKMIKVAIEHNLSIDDIQAALEERLAQLRENPETD